MKTLVYWVNGIHHYGWIFIPAHIFRVYFQQDSSFINNGYDIMSFSSNGKHYFYGTVQSVQK